MKNVKACVDYLSKSWQSIFGQDDQSSNKGPLRYRKPHNGSGRTSFTKGRQKKERRRYEDDHDDFFWWYMIYSSRKSDNDDDDDDDDFF
uniref:Uncharacterized protein n=1 Tax=Chenopodium quinoa TaxID=63459 RepID=A0A803LFS2_CHEQI